MRSRVWSKVILSKLLGILPLRVNTVSTVVICDLIQGVGPENEEPDVGAKQ